MATLLKSGIATHDVIPMTSIENLVNQNFLLRFTRLQAELDQTLTDLSQSYAITLQQQDQLIMHLENWIDNTASLHSLSDNDLYIFQETLSINREVYRMKVLRLHNLEIPAEESDVVLQVMQVLHKKILAATINAECTFH